MDTGWEELERMAMAASAVDAQMSTQFPSADTIERWKQLFGYSQLEAARLINEQRGDLARERISDDHWALIKDEKESLGYDREAYEHSLDIPRMFKGQSASIAATGIDGEMLLLFRLGGILDSAENVREIAGLKELPVVREGLSEMGIARFCVVDKEVQKKLEQWLVQKAVLQK